MSDLHHPLIYVHHVHYQRETNAFHLLCFTKQPNEPDEAIRSIILKIYDFQFFAYIEVPPEYAEQAEWQRWVRSQGRQLTLERRKKCNGYHKGIDPVWRLSYNSLGALRKHLNDCHRQFSQRFNVKIWEDNFEPELRIMQVLDFSMGKWYRWPYPGGISSPTCETLRNLTLVPEMAVIPLVTCAFDLETSGFYADKGHSISMIGMVTYDMVTHKSEKLLLHIHPVQEPPPPEQGASEEKKEEEEDVRPTFIQCLDEVDMLMQFRNVMISRKISVMMGHNTTGFDWKFIFKRAQFHQLSKVFRKMSWWDPDSYEVVEWEPHLRNRKGLTTIGIPGVYCLDTMVLALAQRGNLSQYTLNAVAAEILGASADTQKHDISPKIIVQCVDPDFDPVRRHEVGLYCVQDCCLVQKIVQAIDSVSFLVMMASLCYCQPQHVLYYGTTKPILSRIMRELHHSNKLCNHEMAQIRRRTDGCELGPILRDDTDIPHLFQSGRDADIDGDGDGDSEEAEDEDEDGDKEKRQRQPPPEPMSNKRVRYQGGYVRAPLRGIHEAVLVLDFQSLYPSMMMAYDLCMCNWTLEKPGDDVSYLTVDLGEEEEQAGCVRYIYFVHVENSDDLIIPKLQHQFSDGRKKLKAKMKQFKNDPVQYRRYDTEQLAMKLVGNGTYGALGILMPEVAVSVTAQGRMTIKKSIEIVEQRFGVQVVYGDTDSMFVYDSTHPCVDTYEQRVEAFRHMQEVSDCVNEYWQNCPEVLHKGIINLEPEAVCKSTYHEKKKMYCKNYYSRAEDEKPKIEVKGMVAVRRDNTPFNRKTVREVLTRLLKGRGAIMEVITYIEQRIHELNRFITTGVTTETLDDFIITKNIKKWDYASPSAAVTVALRRKLRGYEPDTVVLDNYGIGDRVPFIVLQRVQKRMYHLLQCPEVPVEVLQRARINDMDLDPQQVMAREFLLFNTTASNYGVNTNNWSVRITGLDKSSFGFHAHHFFFNGVRCNAIEWAQTVMAPDQWTLVLHFSVPSTSTALFVEDPASMIAGQSYPLHEKFYRERFAKPLQRIVNVLIDTQSMFTEVEQIQLERISQILNTFITTSTRGGGNRALSTSMSRQTTLARKKPKKDHLAPTEEDDDKDISPARKKANTTANTTGTGGKGRKRLSESPALAEAKKKAAATLDTFWK